MTDTITCTTITCTATANTYTATDTEGTVYALTERWVGVVDGDDGGQWLVTVARSNEIAYLWHVVSVTDLADGTAIAVPNHPVPHAIFMLADDIEAAFFAAHPGYEAEGWQSVAEARAAGFEG